MTSGTLGPTQRDDQKPASEQEKKRGAALKPLPASIKIDLFGDLLKFSKKTAGAVSFRKFDQLAVFLAQRTREERLIIYKIFCGLSLTAHARRLADVNQRKQIFELKNKLFFSIANNPTERRLVNLRLGLSKRFKVVEYCSDCRQENEKGNIPQREWKFCPKCKIDRNYYNIVSLYHKFAEGSGSLFLGQEHLAQLQSSALLKKAPLEKMSEELSFSKYKFSPKTLIAIEIESLKACSQKLLDLSKKALPSAPVPRSEGPRPIKR